MSSAGSGVRSGRGDPPNRRGCGCRRGWCGAATTWCCRSSWRDALDLGADLVTLPGVGHFRPEEDPLGLARANLAIAGVPESLDREAEGA